MESTNTETVKVIPSFSRTNFRSDKENIVQHFDDLLYGRKENWSWHVNQIKKTAVRAHVSNLVVQDMYQQDQRISAITWHPSSADMVASATKHGRITVFQGQPQPNGIINFHEKYNSANSGPGASVLAMKFSSLSKEYMYIATMNGTLEKLNFDYSGKRHVFQNKNCYTNWFTAMDISQPRKLIAAGDTKGELTLVSMDDEDQTCFTHIESLHKKRKMLHCEFHPQDPNILITASLDHIVKIWDLRYINAKKPSPLKSLVHNEGCNVARFSPDGTRLLTNDQRDEIRIYDGPSWDNPLVIQHHHRRFQHMCPIKASWHPMGNAVVIGLYPPGQDKGAERKLQFIDATDGCLIHEESTPNNGILSLNEFNPTGQVLASSSGGRLVFWQKSLNSIALDNLRNQHSTTTRISSGVLSILRGERSTSSRKRKGKQVDDDDDDEDEAAAEKELVKKKKMAAAPTRKPTSRKGKGKK